jgi:hypothetical protein
LVECVNGKAMQTNGNGASHNIPGYVNGSGVAGFSAGNGKEQYSPEHVH